MLCVGRTGTDSGATLQPRRIAPRSAEHHPTSPPPSDPTMIRESPGQDLDALCEISQRFNAVYFAECLAGRQILPLTRCFFGAEDGIRTRDPHLGKAVVRVFLAPFAPLTWPVSGCSSAESVESARFRERWFNALNLCEQRPRRRADDSRSCRPPSKRVAR